MKRPSMSDKNIKNYSKDVDVLFENGSVKREKEKNKKESSKKEVEKRLVTFKSIREYYDNLNGKKQFSVYLPDEIQKKVKSNAIENDQSFSDVIKELILNSLTDDEIKDAYNRSYDKRNKIKK